MNNTPTENNADRPMINLPVTCINHGGPWADCECLDVIYKMNPDLKPGDIKLVGDHGWVQIKGYQE